MNFETGGSRISSTLRIRPEREEFDLGLATWDEARGGRRADAAGIKHASAVVRASGDD